MNKILKYSLWLLAPLALWAQAPSDGNAVLETSEVTVVENTSSETTAGSSGNEVVEIPEASIEGVSRNETAADSVQVLPAGAEVSMTLPGQATNEPGQATRASEEKISVDFPDEDVRTILRNIADLFELNLVIPDTLQGRTSLKLRNITWQQAFDVVLEPLGFTYVGGEGGDEADSNIIRIKSIAELTTEPVDTRVFVVDYARANDLRGSIEPLIDTGAGGRLQVDVRSNALVITERPSRIRKIQEIIELLDRATEQVMIETKFVEVSNIDDANLGVDWAFMNDGDAGETVLGNSARGSGFGDPGIGVPVDGLLAGNSADGLLAVFSEKEYAVTLEALERRTESKLISNPTVVVMNNREATFQVGEDFPIREFNFNQQTGQVESGDLEYRETGIVLKVTPSVNAAGMISLDIRPKIDRVSDRVVQGPNGIQDQIFDVRRVETQVTIKDGYTIALGGLAEDDLAETVSKVPLVGSLPVVGKLFSKTTVREDKRNLIIFLTAKTLNPDGTTYRDIISPRMLNDVGHTESVTPGYEIPQSERDLLNQAESAREGRETTQRESLLQMEIEDPREKGDRTWQEKVNIFNE